MRRKIGTTKKQKHRNSQFAFILRYDVEEKSPTSTFCILYFKFERKFKAFESPKTMSEVI